VTYSDVADCTVVEVVVGADDVVVTCVVLVDVVSPVSV
jgi:hypothetical protein